MTIPPGKLVTLHKTNNLNTITQTIVVTDDNGNKTNKQVQVPLVENIVDKVPLILEEEVTINLSSTFEPLIQNPGNSLIDSLGALVKDFTNGAVAFSSHFEFEGFQQWKGSQPISLNLNFAFYPGIIKGNYRAKDCVYDPMIALSSLPLPTLGAGIGGLNNLVAPGPSLASLVGQKVTGNSLAKSSNILSLRIGKILFLNNVIVKRAEPTFSMEVDDEDYPIWGKIQLEIESVLVATQELLRASF